MNRASYLEALNPEQREAVEHVEGPLLVLAGAGSGKTRVLTTRIARLVDGHGVDPGSVLAVTFTNKAAAEMRDRIARLLGAEPAGMWIGTFHSIGARILRRHAGRLGWAPNFSIYDAEESLREVKRAMDRVSVSQKRWHPKAVQAAISGAKDLLVDPAAYGAEALDPFARVVASVYASYQAGLHERNAFDFDDLLVKPVELFREHGQVLAVYRDRFRFVLVDEYQDTNHAQYRFLELLAQTHRNIMVVGDDDQSIYGWRGADIRNILDFERDFSAATVVRLERNYRSTAQILEAANRVIEQNQRRMGKVLRPELGSGEPLLEIEALDERDEAGWISGEIESRLAARPDLTPRAFVILYRTNAQSRALEEALRRRDLPYQIVGGTRFYERREIMDVLAYLRLISNPRDRGAFERIVNYPRRGIGAVTRTRLLAWASEVGLPPVEAARRAAECPGIGPAAAEALAVFAALIERFRERAREAGVKELLAELLEETGIPPALRAEGPDGEDRLENVGELVAGASGFDARGYDDDDPDSAADATPLDLFLQKVALVTDVDRHDPAADAVTLMTVHNAKGLEFPHVIVSGLEEGLFPLARAKGEPEELEEERRLFYVALTRGRDKVYLTHARSRRRAGTTMPGIRSSFLAPLPAGVVETRQTPAVARSRADGGWWGRDGAGAESSSDDGYVIDYADSQDLPRFVKGERVRHPYFGSGVIRELTGFGRELTAVIEFESAGRKKVLVRHANLQKDF